MGSLADIKALDRAGIASLVAEAGAPAFRTRQIIRWLYKRGIGSFAEMTDLPADLRASISERFAPNRAEVIERQVSSDGTRKYLVSFADGASVETVGLLDGRRLTVCFSTQAGCAMGCAFCATGRSGLTRDLAPGEMVDQVLAVGRDFGARATNAVAMGQGEPFANYDATLAGIRFMNSEDGPGIGARHITVSTCGIPAGIRRFAREAEQFTLAVSLHSAVQTTRDALMPGMRGVRLENLRNEIGAYADATGRRPTLEYALASGVNDSEAELRALVAFCDGLLCHVNLIPVNPVAGAGLARAPRERAVHFRDALMRAGTECSIRAERGADIDAACGQLRQRSRDTRG